MRRYAVRFIVAVLTFVIGVALTFAFGLFKANQHYSRFEIREFRGRSCREKFKLARPPFLTVDSQLADPLRLFYIGPAPDASGGDGRMRFSVGNNSGKTISGYWITTSEIWESKGAKDVDWTAFEILEPGETSTFSLPRNVDGASVRVAKINFQDGTTWINPRLSQ